MLIASDPASGRMMVLAPIQGSPAEQAGIQPGDEVSTPPGQLAAGPPRCPHDHACLGRGCTARGRGALPAAQAPFQHRPCAPPLQLLNVDGSSVSGLDTDRVAQKLRGEEGSSVWVKVARRHQVGSGRGGGSRGILGGAGTPAACRPGAASAFNPQQAAALLRPLRPEIMSQAACCTLLLSGGSPCMLTCAGGDSWRAGGAGGGGVQAVPAAPRVCGAEPGVCHAAHDG